jgi:O-antigen ligase
MADNAFFIVGWLLVLVLSLDRRFLLTLRRSVCALPITSFALAVVGTLWSDWSCQR